jgi:AraC family transcriptional regulator, regulatory protein of adaptative response / methylated-DNA-[protein]-cysteine methyltransferase
MTTTITHGFHESPFGSVLLAVTGQGICALSFVEPGARSVAVNELAAAWPGARLVEDAAVTEPLARRVFSDPPPLGGGPRAGGGPALDLRGTDFQLRVWEALRRIPRGGVTTYGELANAIGRPGAARAVGAAVGSNPVAYLVPCHRVLGRKGEMRGYRWGLPRKRLILDAEAVPGGRRPAPYSAAATSSTTPVAAAARSRPSTT